MSFERLSSENIAVMAEAPEVGMDIQIGKRLDRYVLIVGGRLAVQIDESIVAQLSRLNEMMISMGPRSVQEWTDTLEESRRVEPIDKDTALTVLGFIHLGPLYPLGLPLPRPISVYGHLPFHGLCSGKELFYRYEHYPTSIRFDLKSGEIKKRDTYAAPMLELNFVNSGLGAVARYALPSVLPACWRYELCPPSGTVMHYGACVPLYGQSGGGVEVMFPRKFKNSVIPIPPPHVLPIF
jgi:hypothetical protein